LRLGRRVSTEASANTQYLQSHLPAVELSYSVRLHAYKDLLQNLLAILHLHTGINSRDLQGVQQHVWFGTRQSDCGIVKVKDRYSAFEHKRNAAISPSDPDAQWAKADDNETCQLLIHLQNKDRAVPQTCVTYIGSDAHNVSLQAVMHAEQVTKHDFQLCIQAMIRR